MTYITTGSTRLVYSTVMGKKKKSQISLKRQKNGLSAHLPMTDDQKPAAWGYRQPG